MVISSDNNGYLGCLTHTGPSAYTFLNVHVFKIQCIQHMHTCLNACMHTPHHIYTHTQTQVAARLPLLQSVFVTGCHLTPLTDGF